MHGGRLGRKKKHSGQQRGTEKAGYLMCDLVGLPPFWIGRRFELEWRARFCDGRSKEGTSSLNWAYFVREFVVVLCTHWIGLLEQQLEPDWLPELAPDDRPEGVCDREKGGRQTESGTVKRVCRHLVRRNTSGQTTGIRQLRKMIMMCPRV